MTKLSDGTEVAAYLPAAPVDAAPRRGRSYAASCSVALPVSLLAEVDDLAEAAGVSRSRWLAEAIGGAVAQRRNAEVRS